MKLEFKIQRAEDAHIRLLDNLEHDDPGQTKRKLRSVIDQIHVLL